MMLFKKTDEWDKDKEPDPTLLVRPKKEDDDPESQVSKDAREFKKKIKHRHHQDLRQFYIGTFDIRLDGIDLQWLNEVHEKLIRKENKRDFKKMVDLMISKNVIFKDLMESTGKTDWILGEKLGSDLELKLKLRFLNMFKENFRGHEHSLG